MKLIALILSSLLTLVFGQSVKQPTNARADSACDLISSSISSASAVFYLGQINYIEGVTHWASSSSQLSDCVVEPGTPTDVGKILQILGSTRTPFAVKGGGHTTNPGFSSTKGVQISMSRFSEITYNVTEQSAIIGAGLIWDDVYAALSPQGVTIVGARVSGIGVAGFTLGGGYSWLTNQYGLTVDTVTAFELVKPDGSVVQVTESTQPDLFFGLKGIVTRFTYKTFPQGQVWGGVITIAGPFIDQVSAAVAEFAANVRDPKATIITSYNFLLGLPGIAQMLFYDAPNPPPGIFDKFLSIPAFTKDVGTRDYLSLIRSSPSNATFGQRGVFHTAPLINYTPNILRAVANESAFWGTRLANFLDPDSGTLLAYSVEPFLSNILSHTNSSSAYPPTRTTVYSPFNMYYAWLLKSKDTLFRDAIRQSANHLRDVAKAEGQDIDGAPLYSNYAIFDTPVENIYGENLPRLRAIKKIHDPDNVMGLAGGFKF